MVETKPNLERLNELRENIIELFKQAAQNVHTAAQKPSIDVDEKDLQPHVQKIGGITIVTPPKDPNAVKNSARKLKDAYTGALLICSDQNNLEQQGPKLADDFIALWSKTQMFKAYPDIINEADPDIQADVSDRLADAERVAEYIQADLTHLADMLVMHPDNEEAIEAAEMAKLQQAENILYSISQFSKLSI